VRSIRWAFQSQSPQTGQVYFNMKLHTISFVVSEEISLNPLKRVKFISISVQDIRKGKPYFVSIPSNGSSLFQCCRFLCQASIIYCRKVSIPSNGSSLFQLNHPVWRLPVWSMLSQSPQTGQVYFNTKNPSQSFRNMLSRSQSPQTGQVYFNPIVSDFGNALWVFRLNPLKRVKFISIERPLQGI